MQQERRVRLYAQQSANSSSRYLTIEFPHLDVTAFSMACHVAIISSVNYIEYFAVCRRALQLHVFRMRPQKRLRRTGRPAKTEIAGGQVRCVPYLFWD